MDQQNTDCALDLRELPLVFSMGYPILCAMCGSKLTEITGGTFWPSSDNMVEILAGETEGEPFCTVRADEMGYTPLACISMKCPDGHDNTLSICTLDEELQVCVMGTRADESVSGMLVAAGLMTAAESEAATHRRERMLEMGE